METRCFCCAGAPGGLVGTLCWLARWRWLPGAAWRYLAGAASVPVYQLLSLQQLPVAYVLRCAAWLPGSLPGCLSAWLRWPPDHAGGLASWCLAGCRCLPGAHWLAGAGFMAGNQLLSAQEQPRPKPYAALAGWLRLLARWLAAAPGLAGWRCLCGAGWVALAGCAALRI